MRSTREQRSWYWYDWANSAFVTTTGTVLLGPYLTSLANNAACPELAPGTVCEVPVMLFGLVPVLPGALHPFLLTFTTLLSAVLLLFVGAVADRSPRPQDWLGGFALIGSIAACLMFFLEGAGWVFGAWLMVISTLCLGASLVIYDAILCRVAAPDDRDRVSSKGWAWGYLGGGLLLAANFALMTYYAQMGIGLGLAIRLNLLSAGMWWGGFTLIPVLGLRRIPTAALERLANQDGPAPRHRPTSPVAQLAETFRDLRNYPQTMLFLLAYLFYNDGIQTVIGQSSLYASSELRMSTAQVMITFLLTQFVAFFGSLGFGRVAAVWGAKRTVLVGLVIWLFVVIGAYVVPSGVFGALLAFGAAIGLVMGGTQALSRSMYSQLVPRGRESEYFSFYQAMERGTSWLGTLLFGLVFQFGHSYRLAIVALMVFFIVGGALLVRLRMRQAITDAGNPVPQVL